MGRPLDGIKVVELTTFVAAPMCGRMLADLGADVVKIESRGGDSWRDFGATICEVTSMSENPVFDVFNAGKKGIVLNLKDADGMEIMDKLLSEADIFLTNTRAKSLQKMGLDYDTLHAKYPRLIFATLTGFGEKGPEAASPGFDNVAFWARTGFSTDMNFKDQPAPLCPTTAMGDAITGVTLLSTVLAAIIQRDRTGVGDAVTISLYNAAIWVMAGMVIRTQERYNDPFPKVRETMNPLGMAYCCGDGEWIMLTILDYNKLAEKFFTLIGDPALFTDPRYNGLKNMRAHGDEMVPRIDAALLKKSSAEWIAIFKENDIVCDRMGHFREVSKDEQAWVNEYVQEYTCRNGETCVMPCPPIRMSSVGNIKSGPAPLVGEHTAQVLATLGYSEEQISALAEKGAVALQK